MHLEGRTDKYVSITEAEYEMLLMYKIDFESSLLKRENAPCIEGCDQGIQIKD
jgi:hypothetical protein